MWNKIKKFQFKRNSIPLILILVILFAYGLLAPWLGYYWDDWVFVWLLHFQGPAELGRSFTPFDPLIGPIFFLTSSIIGESALAWQIFGLLIRALVSLATLWTFRQIWPKHSRQVIWATFFFAVYPGYAQQWIALTHANQEWISFGCFILSLGFTAKAIRSNATFKWTVFALTFQAVGLSTTEYFLGLEFMRLLIIFFILGEQGTSLRTQFLATIKYWLMGYLLVWLAAGLGQFAFHNSALYGGHGYQADTPGFGSALALLISVLRDIIPTLRVAGFEAWSHTFPLLTAPLLALTDQLVLFLIIFTSFGLFYYFNHLQQDMDEISPSGDEWAMQAITLGVIGILGGRIPSWIAGMPITLAFDWDRLLISMMLGACLLATGLIDFFIVGDRRKVLIISLMLSLAIGAQFAKANTFRRAWQGQQNFFWQLAWRIPAMKPGSVLVTNELPLQYVADLQLTAPLNWIYAPNAKGSELTYMLLYTKTRLRGPFLPKLLPGIGIDGQYRTTTFKSSTSNVIVISQPADGCLRVLDLVYGSRETVPGQPYTLTDAIHLSNLSQIEYRDENPAIPTQYFGSEPAHNWCFYFEKAELARQFGDWKKVTQLFNDATRAGYSAMLPAEYLVFIEGFIMKGDIDKAAQLTEKVIANDSRLCQALVQVWERGSQNDSAIETVAEQQIADLAILPECK